MCFRNISDAEHELAENAARGRPYAPYPVLEELKAKTRAEDRAVRSYFEQFIT